MIGADVVRLCGDRERRGSEHHDRDRNGADERTVPLSRVDRWWIRERPSGHALVALSRCNKDSRTVTLSTLVNILSSEW